MMFVAVGVLAVVVACSEASTPEEDLSSRVMDCTDPISVLPELPDDWPATLGVVALPTNDGADLHRRFDRDLGRSFSKIGLVVRVDRSFIMTVAESSRPNAIIGWGTNSAEPVESIEIPGCTGVCKTDYQPGCPAGETGRWVAYPGGIWTSDPACVAIEVTSENQTATVELPVGTNCG